MIARLRKGFSIADAKAQLDALNGRLLADDPIAETIKGSGYRTEVDSLHEDHVRTAKPVLVLVQAGALCLLLIGAANLAGPAIDSCKRKYQRDRRATGTRCKPMEHRPKGSP